MEKKYISLLKELIRNKCVNDGTPKSGNETISAQTLKKFFQSYKIKSEILEAQKGRGNIIARVPGTDPNAPSLSYMAHLDVVPAAGDNWSCDPFAAEERGGYIWGRGTLDMLDITACSAYAFAETVKTHGRFPGDFIYLGVADEEASGRLGARWLVENHWEKVKTKYMITEGGGFFIHGKKGSGITLAAGEKGHAWTRLSTQGESGHGSLPFMVDNAAVKIAGAMTKIQLHHRHSILKDEYINTIKQLGFGRLTQVMLCHPLTIDPALKKVHELSPGLARHLDAISRMTISPNMIHAGSKINIIPDKGEIELDIRILPGHTVEDVVEEITSCLGPDARQFTIEVIDFFPSNISSLETPLYDAIVEIIRSFFPDVSPVPTLFSGVTDARFFRMHGTIVYGFNLSDRELTLDEYVRMLHGKDERISLKSLELMTSYFLNLPEVFFRKALQSGYEEKYEGKV